MLLEQCMLQLTNEQLDWICARIPDAPRSPKGGRTTADKRKMVQGIFWILDNGAKWKDLPAEFGPKSTVHDWFHRWARAGVFDRLMREAGRCVEERGGFRLYECFVDATFSKARQGGDGIGVTRVGKGVKIMLLVDANGLPVAAYTTSAAPHENRLVQGLFDFMASADKPERIIGDKAYDTSLSMQAGQAGRNQYEPGNQHQNTRKRIHTMGIAFSGPSMTRCLEPMDRDLSSNHSLWFPKMVERGYPLCAPERTRGLVA
jgi:transposase